MNTAVNTKWRSVSLPPFDPSLPGALAPAAPNVNNTALSVAELSPIGTPIGIPLGAGLPPLPPVSWRILSGAINASGNGLTNVTAFSVGACSGQLYVAAPVLNALTRSVYVLSVMAFIDSPQYVPTPSKVINVTIQVMPVVQPPTLASPLALNATVRDHSRNGTIIGFPSYADPAGRGPGNFT